jgi:cell division protein FtsZ
MENAGSALMGIGSASGENRAVEAARLAINSPLLDVSITGAKGVLFSIAGGEDLTMFEIQDAAKVITESIDPQAKVIFGTVRDDKLKKNEVKVTVIAAGFPEGTLPNTQNQQKGPLFSVGQKRDEQNKDEKKGRIFNTISQSNQNQQTPSINQVQPQKERVIEEKRENKVDDDDDWGAVPAFLRRSKLK